MEDEKNMYPGMKSVICRFVGVPARIVVLYTLFRPSADDKIALQSLQVYSIVCFSKQANLKHVVTAI